MYKQKIHAPKHISTSSLASLYAQESNRKFLWVTAPLVGLHYFGKSLYNPDKYLKKIEKTEKKFDRKIAETSSEKKINSLQFRKQRKIDKYTNRLEEGNMVMQWGEPVAVFDSALMETTVERFKDYLFSLGYFTADVKAQVKSRVARPRQVIAHYTVIPGQPYLIDSIFYNIPDTAIYNLVMAHNDESLLIKGEPYNESKLVKERERLDLLMKDNGYYDFSRQYIEFPVDSGFKSPYRKIALLVKINQPERRSTHKQYQIDSINFITDAGTNIPGVTRSARSFRDIQFQYYEDNYNLKILSQRVFIRPEENYSRSKTLNTQQQLAYLDAFKFININYDTSDGRFVANIYTSALPRYEWSNEAGVNVTSGFPGPFYNMSFRKRNLFGGLENFELSGRFGFEGVASATEDQNFYKSTEAGVNGSLTFPQFLWPFKERTKFLLARYNPKTKITLGYAYTDRPEYRRTAVSLNGTYSWQIGKKRLYQLTPLNMGVIDTANLSQDFKDLLVEEAERGNFTLVNSFRPSYVSSIIFAVTFNNNDYGNLNSNSGFIRLQLESGGTIWNFVNPEFISNYDLVYFKYLRASADFRRIVVLSKTTTLAYRVNAGVAYPYGDNESLPYEKFFFAGGSNSIRAWRPRRLGPGSFKPELSTDPRKDGYFDYSIEKPAEILLESSVELRKKLFGFVSGAVFIDAGNTWTMQPRQKFINDEVVENGNSEFKLNQFYKEIAVGTGFGIRLDFSFLILRFDIGMKVYDPALIDEDPFVLDQVRFFQPYATRNEDGTYSNIKEPVIYNIGIGYSF